MDVDNLYKTFLHFDTSLFDNLGVMFLNIYHKFPQHYRIYLNDENKPTYINGVEYFNNIKNKLKNNINCRSFIKNLSKLPKHYHYNDEVFYNFCISTSEYIIVGKYLEFLIYIHLPYSNDDVPKEYIDMFCEPNRVEDTFDFIKDCFEVSSKDFKYSFGIATFNGSYLSTNWYDYTHKDIDIDKNYNDDFKIPYKKLCEVINEDNKTGLILLYGEPGTGKSSIIKNLISTYPEKDFVFLDDSIIGASSQSALISYFIENENTIFVLEDCEKILMSRDNGYNPIINTLLNITDGIIGDVLGIKLICTFNTSINNIDKALLRKGRLSVKYEFKKLHKDKVSKILGKTVDEDMTLAEIYNIDNENDFSKKQKTKIGF